MKTIMFANQKGGVGKTTTSAETAYLFSKNKKVLLIDFDAQCNLTSSLMPEDDEAAIRTKTIYDLLLGNTELEDCIVGIRKNIDLIPGHRKMLSQYFVGANDNVILKNVIKMINEYNFYDYVLVDVGPEAGQLMLISMIASDYIVALADTGIYAFDGLLQMYKDIKTCEENIVGFKAKIIGVLLTNTKANTLVSSNSQYRLNEFCDEIGTKAFETSIRSSIKVNETKEMKKFLNEYAERTNVALDYRKYFKELKKRLDGDE